MQYYINESDSRLLYTKINNINYSIRYFDKLLAGIAVNDIKLLHEISQVIRLEKETRFLYELECVFSHQIMTSHPFLRKVIINNFLYR